jgi:hypothetical protein
MMESESSEDVFEKADGGAVSVNDNTVVKLMDLGTVCEDCGQELVDYFPGE